MQRPDNNKIVTMREHAQPAVIPATSRHKAVVMQMPSRFTSAAQHTATVVTMPTRIDSAEMYSEAEPEKALPSLPSAVRLTLLALFAWLGWPRPTHGKGPGAAGARPWKPSRISLFSHLQLPGASLTPQHAAAVVTPPVVDAGDLDSAVINLRAA